MATTYTKEILSASTDGTPILVTQTATPGDLIHTAGAGIFNKDEVWLWMVNNHTASVDVTVEFGSAAAKDNIKFALDFKAGLFLIVPGEILQNSKTVNVFASVANVVSVHGFVNRITP